MIARGGTNQNRDNKAHKSSRLNEADGQGNEWGQMNGDKGMGTKEWGQRNGGSGIKKGFRQDHRIYRIGLLVFFSNPVNLMNLD